MRHICAWCDIDLRPPDGDRDHLISHGICDDCVEKVKNEYYALKKRYKKEEKNDRHNRYRDPGGRNA